MKFGIFSGITWGLDTAVLALVYLMIPFVGNDMKAMYAVPLLHDLSCAVIMFVYMAVRGRLKDTLAATKTRGGRVVMLGGLLGGPIAMTGYLVGLNYIGAGPAAIISAFYPAFGTFLAWMLLKQKMSLKQVLALLIALGAIVVMSIGYGGGATSTKDLWIGVGAASLSVIGWGSEAVLLSWGLKNNDVDPEVALQIRETTSALVYLAVVAPIFGVFTFSFSAIPSWGFLVLFGAALAGTISYLCYYIAIDKLGAPRAMALNTSYAAWAVVFSAIFFVTPPTLLTIVCCIIVIVFTVLAATSDWSQLNFSRSAREAAAAEEVAKQ